MVETKELVFLAKNITDTASASPRSPKSFTKHKKSKTQTKCELQNYHLLTCFHLTCWI